MLRGVSLTSGTILQSSVYRRPSTRALLKADRQQASSGKATWVNFAG